MPRGDKKGPESKGPMTGRGLGLCAGNDTPGSVESTNQDRGLGRGMGRDYTYGANRGIHQQRGSQRSPLRAGHQEWLRESRNYWRPMAHALG